MRVQVPPVVLVDIMIKKIDLLIIKSFFKYFFLIFLLSYFIILLSLVYEKLPLILSKNLGSKLYIQIIIYIAMFLTPQLSVISSVLGTVLSLTRLEEDLVLTALKTLGVGIKRIFISFSISYIFLGVLIGLFSNYLSPYFKKKCFDIFRNFENIDPSVNIKADVFNNDVEGVGIYVGEKDGNKLKNIIVYSHYQDEGGIESLFISKEGTIDSDHSKKITTVNLKEGFNYCEGGYFDKLFGKKNDNSISIRNNFEKQNVYIDMKDIFRFSSFYETITDINTSLLFKYLKENRKNYEDNISELMKSIDSDYRNIFDELSEKKEVLLKTKILNSIKQNKFDNNIFNKADDVKQSYSYLFNNLLSLENRKSDFYVEIIRRIALIFACFFLILFSSYIGFNLRSGSLILPIVIGFAVTGLYFLGESYLSGFMYNRNSIFFLFRKSCGLITVLLMLLIYFLSARIYRRIYLYRKRRNALKKIKDNEE